MALEALSTDDELLNFLVYNNTTCATTYTSSDLSPPIFLPENGLKPPEIGGSSNSSSSMMELCLPMGSETVERRQNPAVQGRKKRKRKPKVCKNKEEAETQRMTHITVERNRRKQMNEHLAILRSLMPESYAQRGDQASIVGGAIQYVKELEHLLHSLEVQKFLLHGGAPPHTTTITAVAAATTSEFLTVPFAQFFGHPQWRCSQTTDKYISKSNVDGAEIGVTLIETHANLRILSRKCPRQLSKMVAGFQTLFLSILHLNVTTLDPLVLYSISAKVEEGCQLASADDIAAAVHTMLRIIEDEATYVDQILDAQSTPIGAMG